MVRRVLGPTPQPPAGPRIVSVAQGQSARTNPSDTYCNKFSAYWYAGDGRLRQREPGRGVVVDFAAWVWRQAGAEVAYEFAPGYLNCSSAGFFLGPDHGTWHADGSGYAPQPGDVAVYGLETSAVTAVHVAVVTAATGNDAAPDAVNGDGDLTGYSVVESATTSPRQRERDGAPLSGYVSPRTGKLSPRRVPGRQGDRLHLQEALQALGPGLAPDARLLVAAEQG